MNRFDTLIGRETLPRTRTMQEHDEDIDITTSAVNTVNGSQSKVWERRIAIVVIVAASVGLFVCAGLLIQAFITHKPVFGLSAYSSFKLGSELLRYYSILLFSAGCLTLLITSNISELVGTSRQLFAYTLAFSGIILVLFSLGLSFISYKPGLEWWRYLPVVCLGISSITMTFPTLISTEQKQLRSALYFISYALMLAGSVLILLKPHNADNIAINIVNSLISFCTFDRVKFG